MNQSIIIAIFCMLIGIYGLFNCFRFYKDKKFAENYIKNSPKAQIWRNLFGEEKAYKMVNKIFAPLGIALSSYLIYMGVHTINITRLLQK
jgi:hypothetical protein